jgi:hypothetical protein
MIGNARVTTNEVIRLPNWWCRIRARIVRRLERVCAMIREILIRVERFLHET